MLDWMLLTHRRGGFDRTVQDRSYSAAGKDWTRRPAQGHVRACALEDGTTSRTQVRFDSLPSRLTVAPRPAGRRSGP
jgi:hypothetical protein